MQEIRRICEEDLLGCVKLAKEDYKKQAAQVMHFYVEDIEEKLMCQLKAFTDREKGTVYVDEGKIAGYLLEGYTWVQEGIKHIYIPVFGCSVNEEIKNKELVLQSLFSRQAQEMASEGMPLHYEIKCYAYNQALMTELVYEQFGCECLEGVKAVAAKAFEPIGDEVYKKLSKKDIKEKQQEILALYRGLVNHLRQSPIFYPGKEFTDEVYLDYVLDEGTYLYGIESQGKLIGMIDASKNEDHFVLGRTGAYDMGDVYVEENNRGHGMASNLLAFAEQDLAQKGIKLLHVEHGTANINARLFWDKHFETVIYTLIRDITVG